MVKCFEHEKLRMNRLMRLFLILLRTTSKSHHEREIAFSHQLNTSVVLSQASNRAATRQQRFAHMLHLHPSPVLLFSTAAITPVPAHHAKTTVRQPPSLWYQQREFRLLQFPGECLWMTKIEMVYCLSTPVTSLQLEGLQKILAQ